MRVTGSDVASPGDVATLSGVALSVQQRPVSAESTPFDVLIATNDVGELLERTLRSIAASSVVPHSVILVLDGVTQSRQQVTFDLPFCLRVVGNATAIGLTRSLKAGESMINSAFLARVDAGDLVHPRRFERQLAVFREHPDVVAVATRSLLMLGDGEQLRSRITPALTSKQITRWLPRRNVFVHGSLMFRTRSFLEVGGYLPEFDTSQDYDLLLRLSLIGRLAQINDVLHTHFFSPAGTTFTRARRQLQMGVRAKIRHIARTRSVVSPGFLVFLARDYVLSKLPSRMLATVKRRSFRPGIHRVDCLPGTHVIEQLRASSQVTEVAGIERGLRSYLERVAPGRYHHEAVLVSSYNVLYRLHLEHALGGLGAESLSELQALRDRQDPNGFLPIEETLAGRRHDHLYAVLHKSALFFQLAYQYDLDARTPRIGQLIGELDLGRYLANLDYRNIWYHSNVLLAIATAAHFMEKRGEPDPYRPLIVEELRRTEHTNTGLWGSAQGASLLNAAAGTFHLLPILASLGEVSGYPSDLVDRVLSLQSSTGLFGAPGGYACVDYDCSYIVWLVHRTTGLPASTAVRVREAMLRLHRAVYDLQRVDGGFPDMGCPRSAPVALIQAVRAWPRHGDRRSVAWALRAVARTTVFRSRAIYNNSALECGALPCESNVFASWFRYLTLQITSDVADVRRLERNRSLALVGLNYCPEMITS